MNYDLDILKEMCNEIDLYEYASHTFEFTTNMGKLHYTSCPCHIDKTPSLMINEETNTFKCWSCGIFGSVIDWFRKIENLSFNESVEKLSKLTNKEIKYFKTCEALKYYKTCKKNFTKQLKLPIEHKVFDREYYEKFTDELPEEWIKEGISPNTMKRYEIRLDKKSNRIVYPMYDNNLNLIGAKGRTRIPNFKELKIQKYMNYEKLNTSDFFVGMKYNREEIMKTKSVILFEGIKSVMKLSDYGSDIGLACETSSLNDEQIKILIKMGIKDVTIAFDSDVPLDKILKMENVIKLKRFTNVYVITNRRKLLGEKESPVDKGKDIWNQLLNDRIKI